MGEPLTGEEEALQTHHEWVNYTVVGTLADVMPLLVARRRKLGLLQEDVGALMGIGQQHVSTMERGRSLTYEGVQRYAEEVGYRLHLQVLGAEDHTNSLGVR